MSVSPGIYNFTLQRRAHFSLALQFKDSTSAAVDLTGATVAAQAWSEKRTTKYADFAIAYTNRSNGQVSISLTDAQTAVFPDNLNYEVLLTSSGRLKDY